MQLLLYSKDPLLAKGLESVLRQAGGIELLPLCSTLAGLTEEIAHKTPDLIVLDLGPEVTFAVLSETKRATSSKIVLWANSISLELAFQAMAVRGPGNPAQDAAARTPGEMSATSAGR